MANPTLQLEKTSDNGKVVIRMTVKNATPELGAMLIGLGLIQGVDHMTNDYTNTYCTPESLDAARKPLISLFGHRGEWPGKAAA